MQEGAPFPVLVKREESGSAGEEADLGKGKGCYIEEGGDLGKWLVDLRGGCFCCCFVILLIHFPQSTAVSIMLLYARYIMMW